MMVYGCDERLHDTQATTPERAETAVHRGAVVDEFCRGENERRLDDIHAILPQALHVALHRSVVPHGGVHGRRDDHRRRGRRYGQREQISTGTMGKTLAASGRGRHHEEAVSRLSQGNVRYVDTIPALKGVDPRADAIAFEK